MIEHNCTIKETAKVLRKSPKTVRRYIRDGLLSARRSGPKSLVVPESELNRFMQFDITKEERVRRLVDNHFVLGSP